MRICIITGGTGGIGFHLCEGFQRAGYAVTALDVEQHKALPEGIGFIRTDLRQAEAVNDAFQRVTERHGAVHVLVNNAALAHFHKPKGGLVSLPNTLAVSLSATPITGNAVSPGWIQADGYEALSPADHAQHPSGRVGIPRDIVNACLFLAHEETDFVNGHNLIVDGGMTKRMIYVE